MKFVVNFLPIFSLIFIASSSSSSSSLSTTNQQVYFANTGSSITLNCSLTVDKALLQQGHDVTWLKQGRFILLPEEPHGHVLGSGGRLRIVPHPDTGVASLHISHVRREDDGRYECLSSTDGNRRSVPLNLSVLEPPTRPVISPNEDDEQVLLAVSGRRRDFQCSVTNGLPRPQNFNWYISNVQTNNNNNNGSFWQKAADEWTTFGMNDSFAWSKLTLDGSALFPKMAIKCEVEHNGYHGGNASTVVKPKVLVPPSALTIWPRPTAPLAEGSEFKTTCSVVAPEQADVDSSSAVTLSWLRNGKALQQQQQVRRVGNLLVSELLLILKPDDNFAMYRCEARSGLVEQPLFEQFQLIVQFAPKPYLNSSISAVSSEDGIEWVAVNALKPMKIKCSVLANPGARILWFFNNSTAPLMGLPMTHKEEPTPNGLGIVTTSTLELSFSQDQLMLYNFSMSHLAGVLLADVTCLATNAVGNLSSSATVNVVMPPNRLSIAFGRNGIPVDNTDHLRIMAGQVLQLNCHIDRKSWLVNSHDSESEILPHWVNIILDSIQYRWVKVDDNSLLAAENPTLSLVTTPMWNGRELACIASSHLLPPLPITSGPSTVLIQRRIRLDVLYSPGPPEITLSEGVKMPVKEGSEFAATCMPSTGNPQPTARWIVAPLQQSMLGPSFRAEREMGGGSTIRLTASAYLDGVTLACESYNQFGRNVSELTIATSYRPIFIDCPTDVTILVYYNPNSNNNNGGFFDDRRGRISLPETSKLNCKAKSSPAFSADDVTLTIDADDVTHAIFTDETAVNEFLNEGRLSLPQSLLEAKRWPSDYRSYPNHRSPDNDDGFGDAGTVALTVTVANSLGKTARTIFMKFSQTDLMPNLASSSSSSQEIKESILPSGNSSSSSFPILIACLTALGVLLIAANVLFISLYVARKAILKPSNSPGGSSPRRGHFASMDHRKTSHLAFNNGQHPKTCPNVDANMFEMLMADTDDDQNHHQPRLMVASTSTIPRSKQQQQRLVTLEDVAGLVLQQGTLNYHHHQKMSSNFMLSSPNDLISQQELMLDSDSGRGESNRGAILLEAHHHRSLNSSCSPASTTPDVIVASHPQQQQQRPMASFITPMATCPRGGLLLKKVPQVASSSTTPPMTTATSTSEISPTLSSSSKQAAAPLATFVNEESASTSMSSATVKTTPSCDSVNNNKSTRVSLQYIDL